jgi:flagellar biogenesis protein FliO
MPRVLSWRGFPFAVALASALGITQITLARQDIAANGGAAISISDPANGDSSSVVSPLGDVAPTTRQVELSSAGPIVDPATSPNEGKSLGFPSRVVIVEDDKRSNLNEIASATSNLRQNEFIKVGGALAVVLGLIFVARSLVKRSGGLLGSSTRPSGVVEILAKYPLGGRGQHLMLLKVARRIVLLHQNGTSLTALTEMRDPDEVAALLSRLEAGSDSRSAAKFRSTLDQFMNESPSSKKRIDHSVGRSSALPQGDAEIIDLTRRNRGFLASMFGTRGDSR